MVKKIAVSHPFNFQLKTLAEFQRTATRFKSKISIRKGKVEVDAKSFIEIIGLLDAKGRSFEITAEGEDAREALMALFADFGVKEAV
jgi:phosphotransferase system HPr (HPr) family protein